jgi:hypothetical protein
VLAFFSADVVAAAYHWAMSMFTTGGSLSSEQNAPKLLEALSSVSQEAIEGAQPPSEAFVDWLHRQASTKKPGDFHRPLGFDDQSAAAGNHRHNGKDSLKIIPDGEYTLPPNLSSGATNTDIVAAINALNLLCRTYLGSS